MEMEFEFKFSTEETNLIMQGLGKLPSEVSMDIIIKIQEEGQRQIQEQQKIQNKDNGKVKPKKVKSVA